ncbi:MAG: choice-of-anchor B family protein, partial [bacterium]
FKKTKMKIIFLSVIFFLTASCNFAQLPNHNTYLLSQLDNYASYSGLWGYVAPDNREYALLGCFNGTSIVDITDSSDIHEVDFITGVGSGWREIKTYSHYAYVVSEGTNSRLQIIDLQHLPDSVSLVTTWNYSGYTYTHAISQSGPYLYLSGGNACANGGVQIIDVTNPTAPIRRGSNTPRYVHDVRLQEDTIWACNISNQKVSIINAGNKDNISEIRNFNTLDQAPHNCAITNDRNYLYVTHENQNPGKLEIWDIHDIQNITFVRNWQPTGITTSIIHNIEIYDNFAFIAHYTSGIRILNLDDPSNPVEVAWYDTRPQDNSNNYSGCWAVYKFPSGKIIGSDIANGLFVIKTTVLTNVVNSNLKLTDFSLSQNYPNPFNPETVISYQLAVNSHAVMKVFDVLGNLVETLVNQKLATGKYSVKFDGTNLHSGIYFYKLEAGSFSKVMKMALIK